MVDAAGGATPAGGTRARSSLHPGAGDIWTFVAGWVSITAPQPAAEGHEYGRAQSAVLATIQRREGTVKLIDVARTSDVVALDPLPNMPPESCARDGQAKLNQLRRAPAMPSLRRTPTSLWSGSSSLLPRGRRIGGRSCGGSRPGGSARDAHGIYGLLLQSTETGTGKSTFAEIASSAGSWGTTPPPLTRRWWSSPTSTDGC